MKIVIDIPEDAYKLLQSDEGVDWLGAEHILQAVSNGTQLNREIVPKWIPMRRNKYPQDGQRVYISTVTGKIHDLIWNSKCIQNYAGNGCWYKNWCVIAWMPFFIEPYKVESEDKE